MPPRLNPRPMKTARLSCIATRRGRFAQFALAVTVAEVGPLAATAADPDHQSEPVLLGTGSSPGLAIAVCQRSIGELRSGSSAQRTPMP
jgi:hypothetical protein